MSAPPSVASMKVNRGIRPLVRKLTNSGPQAIVPALSASGRFAGRRWRRESRSALRRLNEAARTADAEGRRELELAISRVLKKALIATDGRRDRPWWGRRFRLPGFFQ